VLRSSHPQISFVARGAHKAAIIEGHTLDFGLGEGSPLARLYDLNGWVLLLGVGHRSNTSLHLAEYRAEYPSKRLIKCGAPVMIGGRRKWVEFQNIDLEDSDFDVIGESFIKET
jgi:aminoglycoside 3-N-acetyltransferase